MNTIFILRGGVGDNKLVKIQQRKGNRRSRKSIKEACLRGHSLALFCVKILLKRTSGFAPSIMRVCLRRGRDGNNK